MVVVKAESNAVGMLKSNKERQFKYKNSRYTIRHGNGLIGPVGYASSAKSVCYLAAWAFQASGY